MLPSWVGVSEGETLAACKRCAPCTCQILASLIAHRTCQKTACIYLPELILRYFTQQELMLTKVTRPPCRPSRPSFLRPVV